ncbi:unnamed protein product [marine sediment metagenome]|uniref:HPr domain-containing protein n=1 Tax=marine sediment metagenome TaxID=412755 RepID=X1FJ16_9ZZZZ
MPIIFSTKGAQVVQQEVEITNKIGLHVRPASMLVEAASKFKSDVWIEKDGQEAKGIQYW